MIETSNNPFDSQLTLQPSVRTKLNSSLMNQANNLEFVPWVHSFLVPMDTPVEPLMAQMKAFAVVVTSFRSTTDVLQETLFTWLIMISQTVTPSTLQTLPAPEVIPASGPPPIKDINAVVIDLCRFPRRKKTDVHHLKLLIKMATLLEFVLLEAKAAPLDISANFHQPTTNSNAAVFPLLVPMTRWRLLVLEANPKNVFQVHQIVHMVTLAKKH